MKDKGKITTLVDLTSKARGTLLAPQEVLQRFEVLAPEAVSTLEDLMKNSSADSVKLKAAMEILAMAGFTKETKVTLKTEVHDMDEKAIDARLRDLLLPAAHRVIEHTEKDVTDASLSEDEDGE